MSIPKISVVIPCYNQGRFLAEAIESVLSQRQTKTEIVVVNDGSTDHTAKVAKSYGNKITYVEQENTGLAAARNSGLKYTTGDVVLLLDADDYLDGDALAIHAEAHTRGAGVSYGGWREVSESGTTLRCLVNHVPPDAFHALLISNPFPCHTLAINRSLLRAAGPFDRRLAACEDWDMWLRVARTGTRFIAVPHAVAAYRRYASSMSRDYHRMWAAGCNVIARHSRIHGSCKKCAASVEMGRRRWREWCTKEMLWPRFELLRGARANADVARLLARAILDDHDVCFQIAQRILGKWKCLAQRGADERELVR